MHYIFMEIDIINLTLLCYQQAKAQLTFVLSFSLYDGLTGTVSNVAMSFPPLQLHNHICVTRNLKATNPYCLPSLCHITLNMSTACTLTVQGTSVITPGASGSRR